MLPGVTRRSNEASRLPTRIGNGKTGELVKGLCEGAAVVELFEETGLEGAAEHGR